MFEGGGWSEGNILEKAAWLVRSSLKWVERLAGGELAKRANISREEGGDEDRDCNGGGGCISKGLQTVGKYWRTREREIDGIGDY